MKQKYTLEGCLGQIVVLIMTTSLAVIVNGMVVSILWGWFVTPLFDLPVPPLASIIGLVIFMRYTLRPISMETEKEDTTFAEKTIKSVTFVIVPAVMVLLIGYIVQLFI